MALNTLNINCFILSNRNTFCYGTVTQNVTIVTILSIGYQLLKPLVLRFCYGKNTFGGIEYQPNTYLKPILNRNKNEKTFFHPKSHKMSTNLNASERCTSRVDERGILQQFIHEEWRDVEGYFAYDKMVELMTLSYKGKLEQCQTLDVIFWPYSERT